MNATREECAAIVANYSIGEYYEALLEDGGLAPIVGVVEYLVFERKILRVDHNHRNIEFVLKKYPFLQQEIENYNRRMGYQFLSEEVLAVG